MDTGNKLRVGIISDLHIGFNGHNDPKYFGHLGKIGYYGEMQKEWWRYTLYWFKNRGVDLILVPGDMSNACDYETWSHEKGTLNSRKEIGTLKAIFDEVFSGTSTVLMCIYGNHDNRVQMQEKLNGGDFEHWLAVFSEQYSPVVKKEVGGYTFIGAHWGKETLAEPFIEQACRENAGKPVFYIQHDILKNTTPGKYKLASDPENVRDFENLVIFTGHTHTSIVNEAAIWQPSEEGAPNYTTVNCSTLNYGHDGEKPINGENLRTKHALYMTVEDDVVNLERLSFWTDEMIALTEGKKKEQDFSVCTKSCGKDWHFKIGEKVYDVNSRKAASVPAEFAKTAYMGIDKKDTYATLYFPAAEKKDNIHSYLLEVYDMDGNLVGENSVNAEFHIDASCEFYSDYYSIAIGGLNPGTAYEFKVYARDWFFNKSKTPLVVKAK
ncbi:MAG: metallophosphoesterase [Ruminococcaceae bacterium]|nr:metallophosphoesterase [Oscillospiraceae bacterium]